LRYLRIDLGYDVTEQDPDAAYLLFEFQAPGQRDSTHGAFEIVQTDGGVRLWVKLPKLPEYHEVVLRDGLLKKLHEDYGEAPARNPDDKPREAPKKRKPASDAPAEGQPSPDADPDDANAGDRGAEDPDSAEDSRRKKSRRDT
jgi:hypothetical protein